MTKRYLLMFGLSGLITFGACEPEADPVVDEPIVETEPSGVTTEPMAVAPAMGAVLTVAETAEYGPFIADAEGRALYLLEADSEGTSNCYDACAEVWPPYLAESGNPTAGDPAVQAGLISTFERSDGTTQISYGGHALYYYEDDRGPGQATGQDVTDEWGEWYLIMPNGEPLEEHSDSSS